MTESDVRKPTPVMFLLCVSWPSRCEIICVLISDVPDKPPNLTSNFRSNESGVPSKTGCTCVLELLVGKNTRETFPAVVCLLSG